MCKSMNHNHAWDVGEQRRGNNVGRFRSFLLLLLVMLQFGMMEQSFAQITNPTGLRPFDITGFLQEATVNGAGATTGGQMRVNGTAITVPDNTIVILPANALTWQELFAQAPGGSTRTGMAVADGAKYTYEAHVIGNRVGDKYIAGLIYMTQQGANTGQGYINYIDYANGDIYVGGTINRDGAGIPTNVRDSANPGARLRINDPSGKYSKPTLDDKRFTSDPDNPTITSGTGFPMCLPRTDPANTATIPDALCTEKNRPKDAAGNYLGRIDMKDPAAIVAGEPDARIMAPFEVGDFLTYAGTLMSDTGGTFLSAHTVEANIAIFTAAGKNPAYVSIKVSLIGTGGLQVFGIGEAAIRTRFEGMSTDPSRNIHVYAIDMDAAGKTTDRDFGTVAVDPGPPNGAFMGRWRLRPPCRATAATAGVKDCSPPSAGEFPPVPREVRAVIEGAWTPLTDPLKTGGANGLIAGQYHAPIADYIFPETFPGNPPAPNNFENVPFLAVGGYMSSTGQVVGQLSPWPGTTAPNSNVCIAPSAQVPAAAFTVASGATNIPLTATAGGTGPLAYAWVSDNASVIIKDPTTLAASFAAPTVAPPSPDLPIVFTLTVTGCNSQKATATVTVTVKSQTATAPPVISPIAAQVVVSGKQGTITATGNVPSNYDYTWTQTAGPVPEKLAQVGPVLTFTRTSLLNSINDEVMTFSVSASSRPSATPTVPPAPIITSNTVTATVTVKPAPDLDVITSSDYRTGKARIDVVATSNVVNPGLTLTLQPYKTVTGVMFDPAGLGAVLTNTGNGNYTMTLLGAPQPVLNTAVFQVKSNIGGVSGLSMPIVRP